MLYRKLWLEKSVLKKDDSFKNPAFLQAYLLDESRELKNSIRRRAVIICPGGGYAFTSDREAEPVAMRFLAQGFHAFVLRYRTEDAEYPEAMVSLAEAVGLLKQNAELWNLDADKIVICGFSAGGHVCACLGTKWTDPLFHQYLTGESEDWKPAGMILCYPVITSGCFAHRGSFENLLKNRGSQERLEEVSVEKHVTEQTIPVFLWHTRDDEEVPVENSLLLINELQKYHIPYEMHIYESGRHGLSLCDETTEEYDWQIQESCAGWFSLAVNWIRRL